MRKCRFEPVAKVDKTRSFQDGFDEFIRDCNARNLSEYTIRSYETLRYVLKRYCDMNDTSFNNIDKTFYGVYIRPISISKVTNMQEYYVGVSLAYGVIVIAICYIALAVIFKLDKKRFM